MAERPEIFTPGTCGSPLPFSLELTSPSVIRRLMEEAGIAFRKEYGQNFLVNPAAVARIADSAADREEACVLEIGPGAGTLTRELADRYRRVLAVEIDAGLIPVLSRTLSDKPNVTIALADVMQLDLSAFLSEYAGGLPIYVCANLPYYITTPILMRLLSCGVSFRSITVMIQDEVADRLIAPPGSAAYGAITAVLGYYGTIERLFRVPAGCFLPAPKVDSAVVRLSLYEEKRFSPLSEDFFFRAVKAAFGQRRKTLVNALSAGFPSLPRAILTELVTGLGYSPTVRGECLSTAEFITLSDALFRASAGQ